MAQAIRHPRSADKRWGDQGLMLAAYDIQFPPLAAEQATAVGGLMPKTSASIPGSHLSWDALAIVVRTLRRFGGRTFCTS